MANLKTARTKASVQTFLSGIADQARRQDCLALVKIMKQVTKAPPRMWGPSIVGFGSYHYRYVSGREGDWFLTGFSPRKQDLTLYLLGGFDGQKALLDKLGNHKTGKSCLYIKNLAGLDLEALQQLIEKSVAQTKRTHGQK